MRIDDAKLAKLEALEKAATPAPSSTRTTTRSRHGQCANLSTIRMEAGR
jgi:hypothetical protein